ncbi:hypothetical protein DYB28_012792 [Aphanomyces astaci]|uniref:Uncharacterized protein n=1 Tax=Aphanomyces astaci TaxID=112090 RepID=A0A9X8DJD2_APHAT|nr:hypothetical protein DYB28_012792 [Aphanomyces astaci]
MVVGGIAFEYSVEKANLIDKSATPPFAGKDPGRYGIGYFSPDNCDHDAIPCTYSKYPEFDHLAQAYNTTKPSALTLKSFEPTRKESMACPADFPTVPLPARPNVKIFECSVYQPQCNGGSSNKQVTVQPDASTAAPKKPFGPASAPTSAPADPSTPGSNDASSAALTMVAVGVCVAMVQFV